VNQEIAQSSRRLALRALMSVGLALAALMVVLATFMMQDSRT
jgi:hypothetical protein